MPEFAYTIRPATPEDVRIIAGFLRQMLEEMAAVGGYAVSDNRPAWDERLDAINRGIASDEHHFLVAEAAGSGAESVGMIEASVQYPPPILVPVRVLHIHAVFVSAPHRRERVGTAMMAAMLDWGRQAGCIAAELNTLVGNPARFLYERSGFAVHQLEMRRLI